MKEFKALKCLFWLFLLLAFYLEASAQDRMGQLLKERDELYKQYDFYSSQNSAFFGGKSKKDLTHMINTLKGIIAKDNEIIREVRLKGAVKESNYVGQNRESITRLYDLERNLGALRTQLNHREKALTERQDDLKHLESTVTQLRLAVLAMTGGVVVLLFYIIQLRKRRVSRK